VKRSKSLRHQPRHPEPIAELGDTDLDVRVRVLANSVGMPLKAFELGCVNWSQTTTLSFHDVLDEIDRLYLADEPIPFPWNGINFGLGVDPGSVCMGWSVVLLPPDPIQPARGALPMVGDIIDAGVWKLSRPESPGCIYSRLWEFNDVVRFFPYAAGILTVGIESQFVGGNPKTSLLIGRSRGWVEHWAVSTLRVREFMPYVPQEIKLGFAGKGDASKQDMIVRAEECFSLAHVNKGVRDNAADAVGIATLVYRGHMEEYHPEHPVNADPEGFSW
jgi:Holliday junction resolvasome RuvABC endonuclease subunit